MQLQKLRSVLKRRLHFIQIYKANTVVEVQDTLLVGNLIGDALIEDPCLKSYKGRNSCQWQFLGNIFGVPREISFSLFGDLETNWAQFNNCSQISMQNLRRFWQNEGFVKLNGDQEDFLLQQYNIENYLRLSVKRKQDLFHVTQGILFPVHKELQYPSEEILLKDVKDELNL